MSQRQRMNMPGIAAALVGVGLLCGVSFAHEGGSGGSGGSSCPEKSSQQSAKSKAQAKRAAAQLQKKLTCAIKQMRHEAKDAKCELHDMLEGLPDEPSFANVKDLSEEQLLALVDSVMLRIDAIVMAAQGDIAAIKEAAAAELASKNATPAMLARLDQGAENASACAQRAGEKAAEKFSEMLMEMLADESESDDSGEDESSDDHGSDHS